MRDSKIRSSVVLAVAVAVAAAASAWADPVLETQFGAKLDLGAALGAPAAVLLHSDERDAVERLAALRSSVAAAATAAAAGSGAQAAPVYAAADLKALPFFVPRGAVAEGVRKDSPSADVYLDWKGELAKALKLPKGSWAFAVSSGRVVGRAKAGSPAADFSALLAALAP